MCQVKKLLSDQITMKKVLTLCQLPPHPYIYTRTKRSQANILFEWSIKMLLLPYYGTGADPRNCISVSKYRLYSLSDWLKIFCKRCWLVHLKLFHGLRPGKSLCVIRVANQNRFTSKINQKLSEFKRYFGDDP